MNTEFLPLISCIMLTCDRRAMVPRAIRCFQQQNYPNKQLVILDDGMDSIVDLVPADSQIRYEHLPRRTSVGAKRNIACECSAGTVIAHWDDDDWYAPHRLRYQIQGLLESGADICGLKTLLFLDTRDGKAWEYNYPDGHRPWLAGTSLMYTRTFWSEHRFEAIDVGEDSRFVWSTNQARLTALPDSTILVAIIHDKNGSPKQVGGAWWRPHPVDKIQRILGDDWTTFHPRAVQTVNVLDHPTADTIVEGTEAKPEATRVAPLHNVFACLVHENLECIFDLVRNLQYIDPSSTVLLYNGSKNPDLLKGLPSALPGTLVHPSPRPMVWGTLHDFALDCMRFALNQFTFDTLTIVDSDQLALRHGYSERLTEYLDAHPDVGMLGNSPLRHLPSTQEGPAKAALAETELWRPLLRRFSEGEEKFVYWTFWPSTVFTAAAARDLTRFFSEDDQLRQILSVSKIWATEEVILPTLTALLGHKIAANPCSYDYVKYRCPYTVKQLDAAMSQPEVFWAHPIPRQYDDPLRNHVRERHNHYAKPANETVKNTGELSPKPALLLIQPILSRMRPIEGWLEEDEADLLIAATARVIADVPKSEAIVEVGSYCGRATVVLASVLKTLRPTAKVWAIDPHDGRLGTADRIVNVAPSLEKLKKNLAATGLSHMVQIVQARSPEVHWNKQIALLLIDGLHDHASIVRDFSHFEPWLTDAGFVIFHDYARYFPDVMLFVDGLLSSHHYEKVTTARTLIVLRKLPSAHLVSEDLTTSKDPIPLSTTMVVGVRA